MGFIQIFLITLFLSDSIIGEQNITNISTSIPLVTKREPLHLGLILQHLQAEQAEKCDYGANPLIFDLCSNIDTLNLANYHLKSTRVEDLVNFIIRYDKVFSTSKLFLI